MLFAIPIDAPTFFAAAGVLVSVIAGLGAWMFRIDRMLARLTAIREIEADSLREIAANCEKEHNTIWERINEHTEKIDMHGNRITAIETRSGR